MPDEHSAHPDAKLHPEATGAAQAVVKAHAGEQDLKLYAGWFCPFVQRVWTVLEEKKIPYQYIEVNPYHKPKSLLDINPRGLVPTLQYKDKPLYESTVVCEFLDEAYPNHTPHLLPSDPYDRARARIWADYVTSRIIPAFHRFLQYQPHGDEGEKELDIKRQEFLGHLKDFARQMVPDGPFFAGKEPQLPDFTLAPWVLRLWVFDHYKGGLGIPQKGQGGEDEQTWERWRTWAAAIERRETISGLMSEKEHYLPIYQRYADDTAQSELAKATRGGRGVP